MRLSTTITSESISGGYSCTHKRLSAYVTLHKHLGDSRAVSDMTDEFEKVDLEKDVDAMEMEEGAAPLLGFGTVPADGRDEDDED